MKSGNHPPAAIRKTFAAGYPVVGNIGAPLLEFLGKTPGYIGKSAALPLPHVDFPQFLPRFDFDVPCSQDNFRRLTGAYKVAAIYGADVCPGKDLLEELRLPPAFLVQGQIQLSDESPLFILQLYSSMSDQIYRTVIHRLASTPLCFVLPPSAPVHPHTR